MIFEILRGEGTCTPHAPRSLCISQPILHRFQANYARTSERTAICKVHGLSANGGGKKKIGQDWIELFVPFVSMSRLAEGCYRKIQVCT